MVRRSVQLAAARGQILGDRVPTSPVWANCERPNPVRWREPQSPPITAVCPSNSGTSCRVVRPKRAGIQALDARQRVKLEALLSDNGASAEQTVRLVAALEGLQGNGPDFLGAAANLGEIGAASAQADYVGLIYADGNNVGAHVGSISTPAAYRQFATRLYRANEAAVFAALAQHLRPHFQVESADEDRPDRQQFWVDPFEILTIGGDDVMLFVPGSPGSGNRIDYESGSGRASGAQTRSRRTRFAGIRIPTLPA